jgi:dimeric dUTPase (all-alpha-NTP-PPase superfamily)
MVPLPKAKTMTISEIQLSTMLELQEGMNSKVNPAWVAANNNWHRAIQVEGVEAIEHHGWKWWKKQECDLGQLRMELVDIWHFILSASIQTKLGDIAQAKMEMQAELNLRQKSVQFDNQTRALAQLSLLEKLDLLVGLAAAKRTSLALFESLLHDCDMEWNDLFKQYIGKNVLNMFRQDHGYKAGTYIKIWDGREDNEHLVEVLEAADLDSANVRDKLYSALKEKYLILQGGK